MPPKKYRSWLDPSVKRGTEPIVIPRSTEFYIRSQGNEQHGVNLVPLNAGAEDNAALHTDVNIEDAEMEIIRAVDGNILIPAGIEGTGEQMDSGSEAVPVPSSAISVGSDSDVECLTFLDEIGGSSTGWEESHTSRNLSESPLSRGHNESTYEDLSCDDGSYSYCEPTSCSSSQSSDCQETCEDLQESNDDDISLSNLNNMIANSLQGPEQSDESDAEEAYGLGATLQTAAAETEVLGVVHAANHERPEAGIVREENHDSMDSHTADLVRTDYSCVEFGEEQEVRSEHSISVQSHGSREAMTTCRQMESDNSDEESVPLQEDLFPYPPEFENSEERNVPTNEDEANDADPPFENYHEEVFEALKQKLQGPYSHIIKELPQISRGELLLNTLFLSNFHHFNFTQLESIMKLLNSIFMADIMPDTRYKLDALLKSSVGMTFHFVCSSCMNDLGVLDHSTVKEVACDVCLKVNCISDLNNTLFFVTFNIATQLEVLFSDKNIAGSLKNPFELINHEAPRTMRDLYDGDMYQGFISSLQREEHVKNFSCCISVDGASLYTSSNCEIWPLFCCILELPPNVRMHNLLLGGLWFGSQKPKMDLFLKPIIDDFNKFSSHGFQITVDSEVWNMKAHLLCCCADAPARAAVQSVHQHNGSYGCNWCLHPGANRKYAVLNYVPPKRSREELIADGRAALEMNNPKASVNGVLGISPCLLSTTLDIVLGLILEYFHDTNHGIAKQILKAWLGDDGADENLIPYYIGRPVKVKIIDQFLSRIRPPVEVRRLPRKLSEYEHWKGREFENFILYYSVPVLLTVLPPRYLNHWCLFVQALHLLLQEELTEDHINLAQNLLDEFVVRTQELYGVHHMTYNIHIVLHLPENVKRWGPLWAINGYCFEDGNKELKHTIHANRGIASQVCRALCHSNAIEVLKGHCSTPMTHKFQRDIQKATVSKCISIGEQDKYIGKTRTFSPSPEEEWICSNMGIDISLFFEVEKLIHCGCVYSTLSKTAGKTDNSAALLQNSEYVLIHKFIVSEQCVKGFVLGKRIRVSPRLAPTGVGPTDAFLKTIVFFEEELVIFPPSELKIVCARISLPHGDFIIKVPNVYNTC